jgi:PTS hybrid protein
VATALVLVSHSVTIADGVAELAGDMAPDVPILSGAGTLDGGLGTSLDHVARAVERALAAADGVVVLADLGSAVLTVESALDLEDEWSGRVVLADAPFVEGAVAAAVAAQQGGDVDAVRAAAEDAGGMFTRATAPWSTAPGSPPASTASGPDGVVTARVAVSNKLGLHARPAALLARAVADLGVPVTVDGVDASSVLRLLDLGATGGTEVEVRAEGAGAAEAVHAVVALIEGGFGEA